MMKRSAIVGVLTDNEMMFHLPASGVSNYDSLCGIDADDPAIGHNGFVNVPKGQKVNCASCKGIYLLIRDLKVRVTDFE